MAEEEKKEKTKAGKALKKAKEGLIDLAVSYLNTESGLKAFGVSDEELELFLRDAERRKQFIRENTPRLKEFTIVGRIFDEKTGEPLENVKITPLFGILNNTPTTNSQGKFIAFIEIPVVGDKKQDIHKPLLKTEFYYTKDNYAPDSQVLITKSNEIKTDLSTKSLLNIEKAADEVDKEVQISLDKGVKKLTQIALGGIDLLIIYRRLAILKFTGVIKFRLIPLAIKIFILFGVVKIQDIAKGISCPPPDILKDAIRQRNKIVKQLNQIYATIITNTVIAAAVLYLSFVLQGIISQIRSLSFPTAVPPGIGIPYAVISGLESIKEKLGEISEDNKKLSIQMIIALIFLVAALIIILIYLKNIDGMIQKCSQEANLDPLSPELIALREENERGEAEGENTNLNVNGFEFSVVEDKREVGTLKRRFAVAKNKDGVILLKGEPSFSASDQILIDELVFYIKQNDLKAF